MLSTLMVSSTSRYVLLIDSPLLFIIFFCLERFARARILKQSRSSSIMQTVESLQQALAKDRVYIRGTRILTEPSTTTPNSSPKKTHDDSQTSNVGHVDSGTYQPSKKVFDTHLDSSHGKAMRETGYKVAVMGIPMNIPLIEVQSALSKYGEIVLSDMKQESEGTYNANLEFEVTFFLLA